ncbi:MAG: HXXEE domain-containing protein [Clostridiales bacterium]|nr:HXXEE domain-containing protein [Clostridiales bacterium]
MMTKLRQIDFKFFPIAVIILYVPFHLLEEAFNNFPLWMAEHYNFERPLSYPHWLINNLIFLIILLIGLFLYNRNRAKNLPFGLGILIWALLNTIEHIVFSIIDLRISPGSYTSILFLVVTLFGFLRLKQEKLLNFPIVLKSILIAMAYWIVPIAAFMIIGSFLVKIFP